jgi:hypothetical protein
MEAVPVPQTGKPLACRLELAGSHIADTGADQQVALALFVNSATDLAQEFAEVLFEVLGV